MRHTIVIEISDPPLTDEEVEQIATEALEQYAFKVIQYHYEQITEDEERA